MFPGLTTRLSSLHTTIPASNELDVQCDVVVITGAEDNVEIQTIKPHFGGKDGVVFIVNVSGALLTFIPGGNISADAYPAIGDGLMMPLVYLAKEDTWYPIYVILND